MSRINIERHLPFVSIVMPVRNEEEYIERSLNAVCSQFYPHSLLEIIIADGESTDNTRLLIEDIKAKTEIALKIVNNEKKTAPCGLNLAIAEAHGEIIIRVDGHCEIAADYVLNCVKYLQSGKAECIGGPIETIGETLTAQAVAVAMSSSFGVGGSAFRCSNNREMYVDTVAFPGYKRSIFEKLGGFNEELVRNQDDEFNYRLRKNGGRILLAPDICSRYYSRSNLKSLWRQYYQYGFWKVRVLQLYPKQMSLRQFVPFAFVVSIAFFAILSFFTEFGKWTLIAALGLYVLANFAATLRAASRIRYIALPIVFASFSILHFSYGLGFIVGLYKFRQKWQTNKPTADATV